MRVATGGLVFVLVFLVSGITAVAQAATEESILGVDSHYRVVELNDGSRLQSVIAHPEDSASPLNPLFFVQWVSCGTLEYRQGSNSRELLASLARNSGLALVRVERSALDGTGPACEDLDYDTEIAHYVEAFTQLLNDEHIDDSRVYLFGSSLGSTTAPIIAERLQDKGIDIAGIVVQGGGAVTYYERMLNFDRYYLERRPEAVSPADIHDDLLSRAKFQYEYLIEGRHPDEVAKDSPEMARVRNDTLGLGETDQYGRPFAWHQQAAKHNFLSAWLNVDAPVLVIFNAFDQFETRHGHKIIADMLNRVRPGTATYIERPNIDHSDNRYDTIEEAYPRSGGTPAWREAAEIMTRWLRKVQ